MYGQSSDQWGSSTVSSRALANPDAASEWFVRSDKAWQRRSRVMSYVKVKVAATFQKVGLPLWQNSTFMQSVLGQDPFGKSFGNTLLFVAAQDLLCLHTSILPGGCRCLSRPIHKQMVDHIWMTVPGTGATTESTISDSNTQKKKSSFRLHRSTYSYSLSIKHHASQILCAILHLWWQTQAYTTSWAAKYDTHGALQTCEMV